MLKKRFFEKKYPKFLYTQKKHVLKGQNASATALRWFASDTSHIVFIHIASLGEVSAHLFGEEQSF